MGIQVQLPSRADLGAAPDGHIYTVIFTSGQYIIIVIRDETYILEHPKETSTDYAVQLIQPDSLTDVLVLEALKQETTYAKEICVWLYRNIMDIAQKNNLV